VILTALGWIAAVALLYVSGSSAWHAYRDKAAGQWACSGFWAGMAVIAFGILGVLGAVQAAILGVLAMGSALLAAVVRKETAGDVTGNLAESLGVAFRRMRSRGRGDSEPAAVEDAVAEAAATRAIPPVMADPVLGPAPEPAALATAAPVPAPHAALAAYIAGFVPEDDQALKMFMQSNAAGECAIADAWHAFADTCLSGVGLDPAYVAGILEAGDSSADHASLLAQVHKRFGVVYAAIQEWISAGRQLPHKAREFLTGEAA
jgi:hypothetical protein